MIVCCIICYRALRLSETRVVANHKLSRMTTKQENNPLFNTAIRNKAY